MEETIKRAEDESEIKLRASPALINMIIREGTSEAIKLGARSIRREDSTTMQIVRDFDGAKITCMIDDPEGEMGSGASTSTAKATEKVNGTSALLAKTETAEA